MAWRRTALLQDSSCSAEDDAESEGEAAVRRLRPSSSPCSPCGSAACASRKARRSSSLTPTLLPSAANTCCRCRLEPDARAASERDSFAAPEAEPIPPGPEPPEPELEPGARAGMSASKKSPSSSSMVTAPPLLKPGPPIGEGREDLPPPSSRLGDWGRRKDDAPKSSWPTPCDDNDDDDDNEDDDDGIQGRRRGETDSEPGKAIF